MHSVRIHASRIRGIGQGAGEFQPRRDLSLRNERGPPGNMPATPDRAAGLRCRSSRRGGPCGEIAPGPSASPRALPHRFPARWAISTPPACIAHSQRITPGTSGNWGKCPCRKNSSSRNVLRQTIVSSVQESDFIQQQHGAAMRNRVGNGDETHGRLSAAWSTRPGDLPMSCW